MFTLVPVLVYSVTNSLPWIIDTQVFPGPLLCLTSSNFIIGRCHHLPNEESLAHQERIRAELHR